MGLVDNSLRVFRLILRIDDLLEFTFLFGLIFFDDFSSFRCCSELKGIEAFLCLNLANGSVRLHF
jgi:hypothetical protein